MNLRVPEAYSWLASRLCQGWNYTKPGWRYLHPRQWAFRSFCSFYCSQALKGESHFDVSDVVLKPCEKCTVFLRAPFCGRDQPAPRKCASAFREVLHLQSILWHGRLWKCFPFYLHLGRFFFFSSSFLMVFSEGSKWHWSVKVDSKIYNVFVLADCQQNRPFPAVLYADSENQ